HRRVGGERPGDAHTLLLSAGELSLVARQPGLAGADADQFEQFGRAGPGARLVPSEDGGAGGDVVGDCVVREKTGLLDRVADGPPQLDGRLLGDRVIADADVSAGEVDESVDQLQGCGLPAAGGPDEADEFAGLDLEVEGVEGGSSRTRV